MVRPGPLIAPGLSIDDGFQSRRRLVKNDTSLFQLGPLTAAVITLVELVEYPRECLVIRVESRLNSRDVLDTLGEVFLEHGPPEHIRSDNGPEFIATALREWLEAQDVRTLYIEPGLRWENGYCESFNSKLRDELLAREIFYDLRKAQVLIKNWRLFYNTARPHSSLGYKPPAPKAILPATFTPPYRMEAV